MVGSRIKPVTFGLSQIDWMKAVMNVTMQKLTTMQGPSVKAMEQGFVLKKSWRIIVQEKQRALERITWFGATRQR